MTAAGTDVELSKETLAMFAEMTTALDEYETGGGDAILQSIFKATTLDEYNEMFKGERGMPLNRELKVTRVRYAQSEYAAGLPFYLVADVVNTTSGEVREFTVGATVPVAIFTRAAFLGHLPMIVRLFESDKPTKSGYKPVNVEVLAISTPGLDAPAAKVAKTK